MLRLFPLRWVAPVLLTSSSFAALAPQDIPPAQLPAPVAAALKKNFPTATAVSAQKSEERNDYVYFYVTLAKDDKRTLVTITEIGEIVSSEPVKASASPSPGSL